MGKYRKWELLGIPISHPFLKRSFYREIHRHSSAFKDMLFLKGGSGEMKISYITSIII